LTKMPRTKIPKIGESKIRFDLYSCPAFRIFGDLYSDKRLFLHLKFHAPKMTPSIMKEGIKAVAMIKIAAAQDGIKMLDILVPEDLVKFESIFGYEVVNVYVRADESKIIHMAQRTD